MDKVTLLPPNAFDTEYQFTEPIAEFYGELEDFIMVRLSEGKVQIRRVIENPTSGQKDI